MANPLSFFYDNIYANISKKYFIYTVKAVKQAQNPWSHDVFFYRIADSTAYSNKSCK